jgi:hypothetical protein
LDYRLDNEDIRPFTTILPAMAMIHRWHTDFAGRKGLSVPEQNDMFRLVEGFAEGPYAELLQDAGQMSPTRRYRIARQLAAFTGLSVERLEATNWRIGPNVYCEEYASEEGKILSQLDGRLKYPAYENGKVPIVDPKLDPAVDIFRRGVGRLAALGVIPSRFNNPEYTVINPMSGDPHWVYDGIWENRRIHEAMLELISITPKLRVLDVAGYYDLNCPTPRQSSFWHELGRMAGTGVIRIGEKALYEDSPIELFGGHVSVKALSMPMGHQFAYDIEARTQFTQELRVLFGDLRRSYMDIPPRS